MEENIRKTFKLNEDTEVIVTKSGRMTFYQFDKCNLQLLSSEIGNLKRAVLFALKKKRKSKRENEEMLKELSKNETNK